MSIRVSARVWESARVTSSALLLLLALADFADDSGMAWPSVPTLARRCRMTERNVWKLLRALIDAGEIVPCGRARRGVVTYKLTPGTSVPSAEADDFGPHNPCPTVQGSEPYPSVHLNGGTGEPLNCETGEPLNGGSANPSYNRHIPIKDAVEATTQAVDEWNTLAAELGLSPVQKLTASRQSKLASRLKDAGGIAGWRIALTKIRETPGLQGQNDRGWRASFDWLLAETNFTKLMENRYANWGTTPGNGAGHAGLSSRRRANHDAAIAALAEVARRRGA